LRGGARAPLHLALEHAFDLVLAHPVEIIGNFDASLDRHGRSRRARARRHDFHERLAISRDDESLAFRGRVDEPRTRKSNL
jgi:hypothetical protein